MSNRRAEQRQPATRANGKAAANGAAPLLSLEDTFADISREFASVPEPDYHRWQMYGFPCYVALRPMDAGALNRWVGEVNALHLDEERKTIEVDPEKQSEASMKATVNLLLRSLVDYALPVLTRDDDGNPVLENGKLQWSLVKYREREFEERRYDLEEQPMALLAALVRAAQKTNGLSDPNSAAPEPPGAPGKTDSGTAASRSSSETSAPSTSGS